MAKPLQPFRLNFQAHGTTKVQEVPFISRSDMVTQAMSLRSVGHVSLFLWDDGHWVPDVIGIQQFDARVKRIVGDGNIPLSMELLKLSGVTKALAQRVKHQALAVGDRSELLSIIKQVQGMLGEGESISEPIVFTPEPETSVLEENVHEPEEVTVPPDDAPPASEYVEEARRRRSFFNR